MASCSESDESLPNANDKSQLGEYEEDTRSCINLVLWLILLIQAYFISRCLRSEFPVHESDKQWLADMWIWGICAIFLVVWTAISQVFLRGPVEKLVRGLRRFGAVSMVEERDFDYRIRAMALHIRELMVASSSFIREDTTKLIRYRFGLALYVIVAIAVEVLELDRPLRWLAQMCVFCISLWLASLPDHGETAPELLVIEVEAVAPPHQPTSDDDSRTVNHDPNEAVEDGRQMEEEQASDPQTPSDSSAEPDFAGSVSCSDGEGTQRSCNESGAEPPLLLHREIHGRPLNSLAGKRFSIRSLKRRIKALEVETPTRERKALREY